MGARPLVVVGGGMAGGRAAEYLAVRGRPPGGVVLIGEEPERPYHRPYVTKDILHGEIDSDRLYFRPQDFYVARQIRLRLDTRAHAVDLESSALHLEDGAVIDYDKLILAPGASPRRIQVPGADMHGVHYLRTITDARALRTELSPDARVVVIGGGFIGLEVASALSLMGIHTVVVEAAPTILWRLLGENVGLLLQRAHERRGVEFRTSAVVTKFIGDGRTEGIALASGEILSADVVVVGIGVEPNVAWLVDSGLSLSDGILVDEYCRASNPNVFAAGDAARWSHEAYGSIRLEHETNAQNQAMVAARNAIGRPHAYRTTPYVWSDQGDLKLRYVGHASSWDEVLLEHAVTRDDVISAAYCQGGVVRAVLTVNQPDVTAQAEKLFHAQGPFPVREWRSLRSGHGK